jgi:hypothetical protein
MPPKPFEWHDTIVNRLVLPFLNPKFAATSIFHLPTSIAIEDRSLCMATFMAIWPLFIDKNKS